MKKIERIIFCFLGAAFFSVVLLSSYLAEGTSYKIFLEILAIFIVVFALDFVWHIITKFVKRKLEKFVEKRKKR